MTSVKLKAAGPELAVEATGLLTGGMVGVPVFFAFDSAWDGLIKTAVFRAGKVSKDRVDVDAETTVPWEVMTQENYKLQIGIYGCNAEGTVVIPTVWADVDMIYPGADPVEDESTDPSLPVWHQAIIASQQALATAQQLQDRADRGEFNGADGAVGPRGPVGPQGAKGDPGPAEVFIAEYGVTTYAELEAAYNDGKILFCRDGVYYSALYQRTNTGSYTFYSNDSASQVNRFCTSSGWGKKATKLCAAAFDAMRDYIDGADAANKEYADGIVGDIDSALDGIIAIQNRLIGGDDA